MNIISEQRVSVAGVPAIESHWLHSLAVRLESPAGAGAFSIALAGPCEGVGTTTVAVNLAQFFYAEHRKRVVLIDGNLERPSLHRLFDLDEGPGWAEIVNGTVRIEQVIRRAANGRFVVIPAGTTSISPGDVAQAVVADTLGALRSEFDVALIDCAPLMDRSEAAVLLSGVDGLVLVLQAEVSRWEVAARAAELLEAAKVNVLGAVLNQTPFHIPEKLYRLL